jgi:hypothetical protein
MKEAAINVPEHSKDKVFAGGDVIQPYVYVLVFASVSIITGFIWDISWHMSFGRDRFLAPPHIFIYIGAIVAGSVSGFQVLKRSFFGTPADKISSVKFWSFFYSPLGGLFCVWGAIAMLTSAPFDNWWHNTFGLDTKVFSPPHSLLLTGMITIQLGSYISVVAAGAGKSFDARTAARHNWLFAIAAGALLATIFTLFVEFLEPGQMHSVKFYMMACTLFPVYLVAMSMASKTRWGATVTAAVYMFIMLFMVWLLEIFPAKPLLGPVFNHFDHYQPFRFPLLLILPAIPVDIIFYKLKDKKPWIRIVLAALAFLLVLLMVQWYFGAFYHTSIHARNWVFASNSLNYASSPYIAFRYTFDPRLVDTGMRLVKGLALAAVFAIVSSTAGYYWGRWIRKVQR